MPANQISRKEFLRNTAILAGGAMAFSSFNFKPKSQLSFSTLGCPDWDLNKIMDFAVEHGYSGIEVRGIKREMDLVKVPEFQRSQQAATLKRMKDHGLQFVGLGSSANLHTKDPEGRKKQLDDARRFIDLAGQLNCPYVRVFPNNFPKDQEKQETMDLISSGLLELSEYAKDRKVTVLMETHGDLVKTADLLQIMQSAKHTHAALIWDITNMWTVTGEDPVEVYRNLKPYIRHVHVKDAKKVNDKLQYTLLGKGDVPVIPALKALARDRYKGFYSFEWEKLWHPEIAEPEVALADYPKAMKKII